MSDDVNPDRHRNDTRWGRVLGVMALLLVIGVVGLHKIWGVGAGRRLERQAAEYRAAGEPIEPGDFVVVGVAEGDNAVSDLRAAAAMLGKKDDPAWAAFETLDGPAVPLRDDEIAAIRGVIAAHGAVFDHVAAARTKGGVDWQLTFGTPVIITLLPDLQSQRHLARVLAADALLAHHDGDHARAVRRVDELLFVSRAVDHQPFLISHLVTLGLTAVAADTAAQVGPDLRVAPGASAGDGAGEDGAAGRGQVTALIAALLDDAPQAAGRRRGWQGERMSQLDACRAIASGQLAMGQVSGGGGRGGGTFGSYLIRPVAAGDGLILIRHTTAVLAAAETSPDLPAFRRTGSPAVPPAIARQRWRHPIAGLLQPSLGRAVETDFRLATDRRLAAAALAMRLHALDHDGRFPARLEDLVPAYLPAVPLDPMADAAPLRYALDAGAPRVYSVGTNGADDGGSDQPTRPSTPDVDHWQRLDAVVHLRRQPHREGPRAG